MEYLKVAESRGSPKKNESRSQRALKNNLLDAIAQANKWGANVVVVSHKDEDGEGAVRMKIVLKKQDLKKMLMSIGGDNRSLSNSSPSSSLLLEQRMNVLRKRQILNRVARQSPEDGHRSSWTPLLQTIPEEAM